MWVLSGAEQFVADALKLRRHEKLSPPRVMDFVGLEPARASRSIPGMVQPTDKDEKMPGCNQAYRQASTTQMRFSDACDMDG